MNSNLERKKFQGITLASPKSQLKPLSELRKKAMAGKGSPKFSSKPLLTRNSDLKSGAKSSNAKNRASLKTMHETHAQSPTIEDLDSKKKEHFDFAMNLQTTERKHGDKLSKNLNGDKTESMSLRMKQNGSQ